MYTSNNITILVIDDNEGDQLILKEELKRTVLSLGEIIMVNTLSQAIALLNQKTFSLIFLDLFLPDSLGLDSFTDLQKVNPVIPVIIFSGLADKNIALKAIGLGAQDYLIKGDHSIELLEKTISYSIERKRNLEIIKANNDRHETFLKVTSDILWDWDIEKNTVSWSGIGISKYLPANTYGEKMPFRFWLKRLHKDERKDVVAGIYEAVKQSHNFWQSEYRFQRNDGHYDYIYSRGYFISNEDGLPIRMIGSMQDITERKLADKKLAASEKRFKALIQNSSDLITLLDKEGNYLYVSDSAINLLGYQPLSLNGKNVFSFIHADDKIMVQDKFLQTAPGNFITLPPFRFKNIHNQWRWLESTLINMLNETALGGVIVNSRDITARIEAEKQLKEGVIIQQKEVTEAMIEGQEKERSEIGRELHDNVNQLLVATKLYIEMGIKQGGVNELLSSAVSYIMDAIEEIRKLSKTLITPSIMDIGLISSVKDLVEDIMHVNPIKIKLTINQFNQKMWNEKFKLNIFRIVQEQLNNILKHAKAKQVIILFEQTADCVFISLTDDGVGFDTTARKRGVGISNIFSRAALYKGEVDILSSPGNGCRMNIFFNELQLLRHPVNTEVE